MILINKLSVSTKYQYRNVIKIFGLLFLICLLNLFVGCAKPPSSSKPGLTILAHTGGTHLNEVRTEIVNEFNAIHPDTPATIEFVGNEYYTVLQTRITGGVAPDILLWMDASKIKVFQEKEQLLDLTPFVTHDTTFDINDYNQTLLDRVRFNGRLYGLVADAATIVLFYNKDMFDEAGINYPNDTWNWDTFLRASQKLTKMDKSGNPIQFGTIPFVWFAVWPAVVWQNGGDLFSPDLARCTLNEPASYNAVQYIADMMLKYRVAPRPTATSLNYDQEFNNLFLTSRTAMMPTGAWMVNMLKQNNKFRWGVAPLPMGKKRATLFDATYCAIMKNTKNPQGAYEFLKYYCGSPGESRRVRENEIVPALKSVLASSEFLHFAGSEDSRKVFSDVFSYGRVMPSVPNFDEISDLMTRNLDRVWDGDATAKEVCIELSPKVDELIHKKTP